MPQAESMVPSVLDWFRILYQNQDDDLAAEMLADTFFWMRDSATDEDIQQILDGLDRHLEWVEVAVNLLTREELDPLLECLEALYPDGPVIDWVMDASESLDVHLASDHRRWIRGLRFVIDVSRNKSSDAGVAAEVRLLFWSPAEPGQPPMMAVDHPVLWDEARLELTNPALAVLRVSWLADTIEVQVGKQRRPWYPVPLFHLHPERFKQSRPYAEERVKLWRGNPDIERALNEGMALVSNASNAALSEHPLRQRMGQPNPGMLLMEAEEHLGHFYIQYKLNGSQIFDIPPPLTDMLRNTSADDVPIPMLVSPYTAYFLHFGPQADMDLGDGWLLDGCYVEHHSSQVLQFCFTALPPHPEDIRRWPVFPEPHGVQAFGDELFAYDVGTAVDSLLSELRHRLHKEQIGNGAFERALNEMKSAFPDNPMAAMSKSGVRERALLEEKILDQRFPVIRRALSLVINAVCYLTAYPDDIDTAFTSGAPEKLVKQASGNNAKAVSRAKSKLESLGFVPVHFAGRSMKDRVPVKENGGAATEGGERTVRKHWRRGHWRRTPCGVGRQQRRLTWIMPTLVHRSDETDIDPDGHLYLMDVSHGRKE